MEDVTIREATLADLDILLGFEKDIISTERPFDPTLKEGHIHYYDIAWMIGAPHVEVAVAESEQQIIGSGYARIEDSKIYLKHQRHAFLGFMFVKPSYRGKGINKKIIDFLARWALSQNVSELKLEVYNDNLPAVNAYEKQGFSKLLVQMRMEVK